MAMQHRLSGLLATAGGAAIVLGLGPPAHAAAADTANAIAGSTNVETVVVTGTRPQAVDVKKQAQVIMDIAPLEQIRSLPDENAAEALQRLPGVSMESDSGAGRFVNIRGMDADLNGTTYDGVRMMANNPASPQGGARAVALDAFPAGFFGGLEVIKSITPAMDAEGLGGVVNIQPRSLPAGQDHVFDASIGGGVEALRKTGVYKGDVTFGKRFFGDRLAVILSYGFLKDSRGIDDIEADYINDPTVVPAGTSAFLASKAFDDVQYRWYQYHRTRQGFGGGATYSVSDTTELYLRGFHAGYTETAHKQEFVLNHLADNIVAVNNATGAFTSNGVTPYYSDITTKEELGNDLIEVGGKTTVGVFTVDARGSWTKGSDQFPYAINARFSDPTGINVVYNNADPNRPTYRALGGVDLTNPALYTALSKGNSPSKNSDQEYAGVVNFSAPIHLVGEGGVLAFGASVRERVRRAQAYAAGFTVDTLSLAGFVGGPDTLYYKGAYNIGPAPDYAKLLTIPQTPLVADPSTFENDNENVYAGYVQYSASFGALDVVGGVRAEATDGTYRANDVDQDGNLIGPNVARHSYANVFPDLSLKYQAGEHLQLRASFSTAIARPGFNQITAARTIDVQNATPQVSQGNPGLRPTIGRNIDLMASYDLPHGGVVSVGAFYKWFSDYIIPTVTIGATDVPGFSGQKVNLTSFSNVGSAHAGGVELDYSQQFEFLPGPLAGIGFEGNLTYVDSGGQIRPGEHHALPQTSPLTYNAALFYRRGPVFLKLGATYVSTNLWAVGGDASTDLYSQPRFRLDFGATYDVTTALQAYVEVKNITNTHLEFTQTTSKAFPVQNEFYDADYRVGLRVKF
ncbi:TonB-dependent receptor [Caulobacter sp. KR2-114]|uniref:TonB-dependent receptor n=1 Tax=Caulobacter sp. KR2-114 TaxID=3400912 RepID=UPI003C06E2C4